MGLTQAIISVPFPIAYTSRAQGNGVAGPRCGADNRTGHRRPRSPWVWLSGQLLLRSPGSDLLNLAQSGP
jgi:hypothetical protein